MPQINLMELTLHQIKMSKLLGGISISSNKYRFSSYLQSIKSADFCSLWKFLKKAKGLVEELLLIEIVLSLQVSKMLNLDPLV